MKKNEVLASVVTAVVECGKKGGKVFLTDEGMKTFHEMVKSEQNGLDLQRFSAIIENAG